MCKRVNGCIAMSSVVVKPSHNLTMGKGDKLTKVVIGRKKERMKLSRLHYLDKKKQRHEEKESTDRP